MQGPRILLGFTNPFRKSECGVRFKGSDGHQHLCTWKKGHRGPHFVESLNIGEPNPDRMITRCRSCGTYKTREVVPRCVKCGGKNEFLEG